MSNNPQNQGNGSALPAVSRPPPPPAAAVRTAPHPLPSAEPLELRVRQLEERNRALSSLLNNLLESMDEAVKGATDPESKRVARMIEITKVKMFLHRIYSLTAQLLPPDLAASVREFLGLS